MAEVTGTLNGEPIELNNAATELTLRELVAVTKAMAASKGLTDKAQKELDKTLRSLTKETNKFKKSQEANTDAVDDNTKANENFTTKLEKNAKRFDQFSNTLGKATLGITNIVKDFSNLGNSLSSAAQSFNAIPVVGGVLSGVFGAVAGAAEKSYKSFQESASVGANFGGSITDMINAASGAGLTFDQFSNIIAKNGEAVALLGKGSNDGAKRLAQLGKEIRDSGAAAELYRMGYSTEDISNGMAQFAGRLAKGGALQTMTTAQIAKVTGSYLRELDAVAKLTGQSKEALQEQENARMRDAQYLNLKNKLDGESQKNLELLMSSIPKGMQAGAKEVLATGTATTEAGEQFLAFMKQSGMSLTTLGQDMRKTGKLSLDSVVANSRIMQKEGAALAKSPIGDTLSNFLPEFDNLMVSANELGARQTDLGKTIEENNEIARKRKEREQELLDKGLDPASMAEAQQKIADVSNEFTKALANSGLLQTLMESFGTFSTFITETVLPGFEFLAKYFNEVVIGMVALKGISMALTAAKTVLEFMTWRNVAAAGALSVASTAQAGASAAATGGLMAMAAGLWAAIAPVLAVAAPFIAIAAAVTAVVVLFKKLYEGGWTFGTVIEAVKDNFSRLLLTLERWWNGLMSMLPEALGGISAEEEKRRAAIIKSKEDELDQREKERDQKRKDQRQARGIKEEEAESSKKLSKAKEEEKKAVEGVTKPTVDYGNTLSILKDQQKAQTQPGATAVTPGVPASTTFASGTAVAGGVKAMLDQISKGEGTSDEAARKKGLASGYDVSLGYGAYGGGPKKAISEMSIAEVKEYQEAMLKDPTNKWKSSAVGKYQIVGTTLKELQKELGFKDTDKFDAAMQDKLGEALLKRRGLDKYTSGKMSAEKFQLGLSQEWASIADPRTGKGFYSNQQTAHTTDAMIKSAIAGLTTGGAGPAQTVATANTNQTTPTGEVEQLKTIAMANADRNTSIGTPIAKSKPVTPAQPLNNAEVIKQAQEKYKADKAAEEAKKKAEESKKPPTTAPTTPTQESAESLLASLNNKMDQLIKYTAQTTTNTYQQVVATKGLSTDVFNAV